MKKIAFFIPSLNIGGIERVFVSYANYLKDFYNVYFVVIKREGILLNNLSPNINIIELNCKQLRFSFFKLCKVLHKEKFDYIITGTEVTNILAFVANKFSGSSSKLITSQHNYNDIESYSFLYKYIIPYIHNNAYYTFAVSKGIKKFLISLGVNKDKIKVIYNPIDCDLINEISCNKTVDLPNKYIIFVGRVYPIKNIPLLIKSFVRFHKIRPDYKLIILGDGESTDSYKNLCKELDIENEVIWKGQVSNPYPYIKNAELLVVSSLVESLSNVVLEALSVGTTVVSTPCKGPEEILSNSQYGYIAKKNNNVDELTNSILFAIDNKIEKNKLINYSKKFDIKVSSELLMNIMK